MALLDLLTFPHFIIMLLAMVFFTIAIILVNIHKPTNWFLLHKYLTILGLIVAVIAIITLLGLNLMILHGIFGLITVIINLIAISGGYAARKRKSKNIRKIHIWIGRINYVLLLVALFFGIIIYI